jgi:hypothetical protein
MNAVPSPIFSALNLNSEEHSIFLKLPSQLSQDLIPILYRHQKTHPDVRFTPLVKAIKNSERSAQEWCEAVVTLTGLLTNRGQKATLHNLVGYLHCCNEGGVNEVSLKSLATDFFESYGFEQSS